MMKNEGIKTRSFGRLMLVGLSTVLLVGISTRAALAQSKQQQQKALQHYTEGKKKANLGKFKDAIEEFEKGYETIADASFLFNIAQTYRQWGDCNKALFFYNRFMLQTRGSTKAQEITVRKEVEQHIASLEKSCKELTDGPPNGPAVPDIKSDPNHKTRPTKKPTKKPKKVASTDDDDDDVTTDDDDDTDTTIVRPAYQPKTINSSAAIGAAFLGLGDLDVPAQFSLRLGAGYPLPVKLAPKVSMDVGGLFTFTPVPWDNPAVMATGTASLTTLLANLGGNYAITNKIGVRAEVGLGVLFFGGLSDGNVFTVGGAGTTGALSIFNFRFGVSGEYALTNNIVVTAHPVVYSYSPSKEGLRPEIPSLTRFEVLLGAGYRM